MAAEQPQAILAAEQPQAILAAEQPQAILAAEQPGENAKAPSFCEQKEAKKLYDSGVWGVAPSLPHHRTSIKESFLYWSGSLAHALPHPMPWSQKGFWVLFSKNTACLQLSV
jgi:hypothetical protein